MSAHSLAANFDAPTFPACFWLVADLSELTHGFICEEQDEVREAIHILQQRRQPWRVLRIGEGEYGRDVSCDFVEDPVDEFADPDPGWTKHVRSFSRPSGY